MPTLLALLPLSALWPVALAGSAASAGSTEPTPAPRTMPWLPQPHSKPASMPTGASGTDDAGLPSVARRDGLVEVWVELDGPAGPDRAAAIATEQDALMTRLAALGAVELARVRLAMNAVAVRVQASKLDALERLPGVRAVRLVRTIERPPVHRQPSPKPTNGASIG